MDLSLLCCFLLLLSLLFSIDDFLLQLNFSKRHLFTFSLELIWCYCGCPSQGKFMGAELKLLFKHRVRVRVIYFFFTRIQDCLVYCPFYQLRIILRSIFFSIKLFLHQCASTIGSITALPTFRGLSCW